MCWTCITEVVKTRLTTCNCKVDVALGLVGSIYVLSGVLKPFEIQVWCPCWGTCTEDVWSPRDLITEWLQLAECHPVHHNPGLDQWRISGFDPKTATWHNGMAFGMAFLVFGSWGEHFWITDLRSHTAALARPMALKVTKNLAFGYWSSSCVEAKFKLKQPVDAKGAEREVWILGCIWRGWHQLLKQEVSWGKSFLIPKVSLSRFSCWDPAVLDGLDGGS